jgi:hypothetical protein
VAFALLWLLVGVCIPTSYAVEKLQGFGRAVMGRLPYEPPAGLTKKQALIAAQRREDGVEREDAPKETESDQGGGGGG